MTSDAFTPNFRDDPGKLAGQEDSNLVKLNLRQGFSIRMSIPRPRICPAQPGDENHFCRLFEPLPRDETFDPRTMRDLGRSMGCALKVSGEARTPAVAYTYFGQFIDHDLTRDETPFDQAGLEEPNNIVNHGGGRLDLSHVYGEGPGSKRHGQLYEEDGASFRLGEVCSPIAGEKFDLPLDGGQPLAADDRTPENLIQRQLCVMFMRLHNIAVRNTSGTPEQRFRAARQEVTWQYQWLVRRDFMEKLLASDVYAEILRHENGGLIDWGENGFSIPVEFSQAAFRFGHSMVRSDYVLNKNLVLPLEDIFAGPARKTALMPQHAIDWSRMTDVGRQRAKAIDTSIVVPLFHLPEDQFDHKKAKTEEPLPRELAVRTLRRGAATCLPTGEQVATVLGHQSFSRPPSSVPAIFALKMLAKYNLIGRTPLWYYILLEADVESNGNRLGTIGSRLVGEVIESSLRTDPSSYIRQFGTDWDPPMWRSPYQSTIIRDIFGAALVGGLYKM